MITRIITRSIIFNNRFTWNYISNNILGRQVRRKVRLQARISRRSSSSNLHDRPVSSWCNTTLAPPIKSLLKNLNWWLIKTFTLPKNWAFYKSYNT